MGATDPRQIPRRRSPLAGGATRSSVRQVFAAVPDPASSRGCLRVVSRDPDDLAVVTAELERRYGADYDIAAWPDPDAALEDLRRLRAADRPVALVLACQHAGDDAVDFLGRVRGVDPHCQRAVIVRWGDFATSAVVLAALARGELDRWMLRPEYPGDEEFHRSVTELLEIVGRGAASGVRGGADRRRAVVAARRRAARSHEPQQRAVRLLRQRRRGWAGGAAGARPHGGDG